MKKTLVLIVMAGCASLLQADYSNGSTQGGYSQNQMQQNPASGGGYSSSYESRSTQSRSYQSGSAQYGQNGYAQGQSQYSSSDQALSSKIQETLNASNKYRNVTFNVSNGNVTLQGTVSNEDDKTGLGALIGGIDGVRSVSNQVTTQDSSYSGSQSYSSPGYNNGSYSSSSSHHSSSSTYGNGSSTNYGTGSSSTPNSPSRGSGTQNSSSTKSNY